MYREPSPTGAKTSSKNDPSAAARSTIRRHPTIRRPSRNGSSTARLANGGHFPPTLRRQLTDEINRELERETGVIRRHARSPVFGDDALLDPPVWAEFTRREAGQRLLRDALRHSHPGRRLRIPREPTLRFEMPLWATSDLLNRSSSADESGNQQTSEHLPFTPRFAPAFAYHSTISSQPHPDVAALSPFRLDGSSGDDSAGSNIPLLRRVGHRSVSEANRQAHNRDPTMDGLGDRQRSVSPDGDDENDTWETLLATITPDARLPSTDSSFTSTTASASTDLSRNGGSNDSTSSSQTLPSSLDSTAATMHMILDPYPEFFNPCDYPTSSESDTEADSDADHRPFAAFRRRRRAPSRLLDSLRRSYGLGSTQDNQPPIPAVSFSFSQDTVDPDLQQMQAILDRLARREDIPDEWWAAAGLSRTIGRRLGAGDELPNTSNTDGPVRERL